MICYYTFFLMDPLALFHFSFFATTEEYSWKTLNRNIDLVLYSQFFFFKKEKTKKEK